MQIKRNSLRNGVMAASVLALLGFGGSAMAQTSTGDQAKTPETAQPAPKKAKTHKMMRHHAKHHKVMKHKMKKAEPKTGGTDAGAGEKPAQ